MTNMTNMTLFTKLVLGFFLLLVGMIYGSSINALATEKASNEVYDVCNAARQEDNGASEQACGDLQDKYHIDFQCNERNSSPTNTCWTEAN